MKAFERAINKKNIVMSINTCVGLIIANDNC